MKNHHEGGKGLRGGGNRESRLRHIEVSSCVDFLLQRVRQTGNGDPMPFAVLVCPLRAKLLEWHLFPCPQPSTSLTLILVNVTVNICSGELTHGDSWKSVLHCLTSEGLNLRSLRQRRGFYSQHLCHQMENKGMSIRRRAHSTWVTMLSPFSFHGQSC